MARRRWVCVVLALLVAAGWLLGAPGAAFAVKEREALTGEPCGSGPTVGKVVIKDLKSGGVKVKVRIKNGKPNDTSSFSWVATNAPRSCAIGEQSFLGFLTTDGSGRGRLVTVLPGGNPFPGKFAMILGQDSVGYYAPFDNIFQ